MQRINYDIIDAMLSSSETEFYNRIRLDIKLLIDYANHVSTMESKIQELVQNNNSMSDYMIRELEKQRWIKHDAAISGLYELNKIAYKMGLSKVYSGDFNDNERGSIAQAIFEFCKWYLEKY